MKGPREGVHLKGLNAARGGEDQRLCQEDQKSYQKGSGVNIKFKERTENRRNCQTVNVLAQKDRSRWSRLRNCKGNRSRKVIQN